MNKHINKFIKLLFLLPFGINGLAQAAAPFVPDDPFITGYVGSPAASGFNLRTDRVMYAIDYSSQDWSGNLHAYNVNTSGTTNTTDNWVTVDGLVTKYGAAPKIDAQAAGEGYNNSRKIVTRSGTTGVPFLWSNLSTAQKNLIDPGTANTATNSPVLDYIRGDRKNEAPAVAGYSTRSTVLGDIIHATPRYWNDGTNKTVFVGANDGMLHAINADTGSERFAYIPSMLIPKLNALKDAAYTHKYYVDGQLAIATFNDAALDSGASATVTASSTFTSILAGGLGAGGKGIFALNVTAVPITEADAASKVMWEISNTSAGFTSLGDTYGKPVFATLQDGTPTLIMANGYNNTNDGHAYLYIINPKTGVLIKAMDTGIGTKASPNGLSSPTLVDTDFDGRVDHAYAGDIDGKLWKFNLGTATARAQAPTLLHTTSPAQAITTAPNFKPHPDGGYMVTFVTGRIFTVADKDDKAIHYAYGIWDRPLAYADNADILEQSIFESNYTYTFSGVNKTIRVRTATKNQPYWGATFAGEAADQKHHKGWKTALPVGGERVVGDGAQISDAQFIFLSSNPTLDPDSLPPGQNWFMQLNALTGGNNTDIRFDLNSDSRFTTADKVSVTNAGTTTIENPAGRHLGGGVRSQLVAFTTTSFDIYIASYDKNGAPVAPDNSTTPDPSVVQTASTTLAPFITVNTPADSVPTTVVYSSTGTTSSTNTETNTSVGAPVISSGSGVAGGHFDEDIYYGPDTLNKGVTTYTRKLHHHEYDDTYDKTGVNMLAASDSGFNLSKAILSTSTQFKVLVQNQYLNPAVSIHVNGSPTYVFNLDQGYIPIKNYTTSSTFNISSLPTYTRDTVKSLAINMPTDAFAQKDWWNTGTAPNNALPADIRVGLHPTVTGCVNKSAGTTDGNLYQPVIPPGTETNFGLAANSIPEYGKLGYSTTTTPLTAKGVRHNGALIVQVIAAATPQSELEMTVPNRPEYGWRVKAAFHDARVLAEYTTFWHHPNGKCYGSVGWTKLAPQDPSSSTPSGTPATGSSDPKIGGFAVNSAGAFVPPTLGTTVGTPVTNPDGSVSTPTTVVSLLSNGSYSSVTSITTVPPKQTIGTNVGVPVVNPDGSITTTTTTISDNGLGGYTTKIDINTVGATGTAPAVGTVVSAPVTNANGSVTTITTVTVRNANGTYTSTATANTTAYDTVIANPALVGDSAAAIAARAAIAEAKLIADTGITGKVYPPVTNADGTITVTRKIATLVTAANATDPALIGTYTITGVETTYAKGTNISNTGEVITNTPTTNTTVTDTGVLVGGVFPGNDAVVPNPVTNVGTITDPITGTAPPPVTGTDPVSGTTPITVTVTGADIVTSSSTDTPPNDKDDKDNKTPSGAEFRINWRELTNN